MQAKTDVLNPVQGNVISVH